MTTPDFNRRVAEIIAQENGKPISAADICLKMQITRTENNKRKIRYAVNRLVTVDRLPIASEQNGTSGYRWCVLLSDRQAGARVLVSQAIEMLKRARVLVNKREVLELLGQGGFSLEDAA